MNEEIQIEEGCASNGPIITNARKLFPHNLILIFILFSGCHRRFQIFR